MNLIAVLSDVHGNIDALNAAIEDIGIFQTTRMVCLGDIVGYGPAPRMCFERLREMDCSIVLGNHEIMHLSERVPRSFSGYVGDPLGLGRRQLDLHGQRWLSERPFVHRINSLHFSHAGLREPSAFEYIRTAEQAASHLGCQDASVSFIGHTHIPWVWREKQTDSYEGRPALEVVKLESDTKYCINVGSVGQPRDGDLRACYALYDCEKQELTLRRVAYDISRAVERFQAAGLPNSYARRIQAGR